jgi:hypothetical protein
MTTWFRTWTSSSLIAIRLWNLLQPQSPKLGDESPLCPARDWSLCHDEAPVEIGSSDRLVASDGALGMNKHFVEVDDCSQAFEVRADTRHETFAQLP